MLNDGTTPLLADREMRDLGFTDHTPTRWYYCKRVGNDETLNLTVVKATGVYEEYVLDESFGQPAYYGNMREPFRSNIREAVDAAVERLNLAGLNISVDHSQYGFHAT